MTQYSNAKSAGFNSMVGSLSLTRMILKSKVQFGSGGFWTRSRRKVIVSNRSNLIRD